MVENSFAIKQELPKIVVEKAVKGLEQDGELVGIGTDSFYQEEEDKVTLKEFFNERMARIDPKRFSVWNMN